jgi:hypothetical protein
MECASKYAWMNTEDDDALEVEIGNVENNDYLLTSNFFNYLDDVTANITTDQLLQPQQQSASMPAAPAAPPVFKINNEAAKKKRVIRTRKADTNVISIDLGSLENGVTISTGDPIFCSQCKAILSAVR